jgi:hypothetical protein
METRKAKRLFSTAAAAVLAIAGGMGLTGCDGLGARVDVRSQANAGDDALTRKEVLALQHMEKDHETSEEALAAQVAAFLDGGNTRNAAAGGQVITGVKKFISTTEKGFSNTTANARNASGEPEFSEIQFYLFDLENPAEKTKGFALTCGDNRIGNILAVVEEGTPELDNPFMEIYYTNLENYIAETIEMYNSITDEDIAQATEKANALAESERATARAIDYSHYYDYDTNGKTRLKTTWGQHGPYWDIIYEAKGRANSSSKFLTGCTATAMAQIAAYWQYPAKCSISPYTNIQYVWADMKAKPNAYELTAQVFGGSTARANNAKRAIAALMYEVAESVGMKYGTDASGAFPSTSGFNKLGYKTPSGISAYNISTVKSSINNGRPLIIYGYDTVKHYVTHYVRKYYFLWWVTRTEEWDEYWDEYENGHTWVIDDYRRRTGIVRNNANGYTYYPVEQVHCNIGWGGYKDGWYLSGVFNTKKGPVERSIDSSPGIYQYNINILPNVYR